MDPTTEEIRQQIATLKSELAIVRGRVALLKRRRDRRKSKLAVTIAGTVGSVLAFSFFASAQVPHIPGTSLPGKSLPTGKIHLPVHAPFIIEDQHGVPVFVVRDGMPPPPPPKVDTAPDVPLEATKVDPLAPRGAYVFNGAGAAVAAMQAIEDGGGVVRAMQASDPETRVSLGVAKNDGGLNVRDGKPVASVNGDATRGSIAVSAGGNFPIAEITAKEGGKGFVGVYDEGTRNPLVYLTENKLGAGEITGYGASAELVVWYVQGGPRGAVCCVMRHDRAFFMGDRVLIRGE